MIFFRPCDPNRQTDVKKKFSLEHPGEPNKYSLVATQNLTHQKEKKWGVVSKQGKLFGDSYNSYTEKNYYMKKWRVPSPSIMYAAYKTGRGSVQVCLLRAGRGGCLCQPLYFAQAKREVASIWAPLGACMHHLTRTSDSCPWPTHATPAQGANLTPSDSETTPSWYLYENSVALSDSFTRRGNWEAVHRHYTAREGNKE